MAQKIRLKGMKGIIGQTLALEVTTATMAEVNIFSTFDGRSVCWKVKMNGTIVHMVHAIQVTTFTFNP